MRNNVTILLCLMMLLPFISFAQEEPLKDTTEVKQTIELPSISLSASDLEEGETGGDNISGLLYSSKDTYVSVAGYQFGSTRYRIRGYGSEMTTVAINGVQMNDVETGRAYWSTWGGLNDATRTQIYQNGLGYSDYGFGNVGGFTNITTKASQYRTGTKLTYSSTNRSYRNRLMVIHSTGMMENGWAITASASKRWAQEGYVEGSFYDAYSYFLAIERKINNSHSINFTGFGAPRKYAGSSPSTQEAYDLAGTNFYNPNWGYLNGEKRNAKVKNYHKPFFALTHYWNITEKSRLTSSASFSFGRGGSSALNWFTGNDPRPDYYKNLPSYYGEAGNLDYDEAYLSWTTDENRRQLDWNRFYTMNQNNQETIYDADGQVGNTVTGKRSVTIIEERRNDHKQFGFNSVYNHEIDENLKFNAGFNVSIYKGNQFKVVDDLLGGDFYVDVNKYIMRDSVPNEGEVVADAAQNDLNNKNNVVKEGERFGYDFVANVNTYDAFGQVNYTTNQIEAYAGVKLSNTTMWRHGNMKSGVHPENSYGKGEVHNFFNYAFKGGLTYKISGRHYVQANGSYKTVAPYFRNAYYSSRTKDGMIDGLESNVITTGDLSYIVKMPRLKGRLTGFYNTNNNQTLVQNLYVESVQGSDRGFGSYIWKGVDMKSYGFELGLEANLTAALKLTAAGGMGNYIYNSRPDISMTLDVQDQELPRGIAYLKNYKIGGFPQTAGSVGLTYFGPKRIRVGFNVNYYDDIYVSLTPEKHLDAALYGYTLDHPLRDEILEQEKFDSNFTVDFSAGKSWRLDDYYISLNFSVNNVLNNQDFKFGGYEQFRFDRKDPEKFGSKYFYLYGTQYFLNLSFSF